MHIVSADKDYALLDFGNGRKLERFGPYLVDRPAPQADKPPALPDWQPDWIYTGARVGEGGWQARREGLAREWQVEMHGQRMHCRLGKGGQIGIYPEHAACWHWIREQLEGCYHIEDLCVLNLFAGTGGATLAAVMAGARVTHVDAQAAQLELARLNVGEQGARFIREDVMTYVQRLLRKGERFHMVIMDPPSFGRGGKNKVWDIRCDFQPLIKYLPRLLTDDNRGVWVSLHTQDMNAQDVADLLGQVLPGKVQPLELGIATAEGDVLPGGVAATWCRISTGD
ncbi:MAG: class I SAM-dependent methyltransferase [Granulosicoccaceae bacterium]|jgi:23S rRNA (cytosine1962-C5)-methyltransferase